ncbi:MAG: ABC transporter ATP-binding protein/permease [Methanobrevibacter sp.]|jgi:ATP-binding cassette subfamily B protein/subfamily B ATP-binding cassette protein MsbA|nr:ABC transporter ATP-binding protein/permease [Methanobrevibacter sp.]
MFKYLLNYKKYLISIFILTFTSYLYDIYNPLFIQQLVDNVLLPKNFNLLYLLLIEIGSLFIISIISKYMKTYLLFKFEFKLYNNLSTNIFSKILSLPFNIIQKYKITELSLRNTYSIKESSSAVFILFELIGSLIMVLFPLIIMFKLSIYLTLLCGIPCLCCIIINYVLSKKNECYQEKIVQYDIKLSSFINNTLSNIKLVKNFKLKQYNHKKNIDLNDNRFSNGLKSGSYIALNETIIFIISILFIIIFIYEGTNMIIQNQLSVGVFIAFLNYLIIFFQPPNSVSSLWMHYKTLSPSFNKVKEIDNLETDISSQSKSIFNVEFVNLSNIQFKHDKMILSNFTCKFTKGLNYIIGSNGSGKSTLINLINNLYEPDYGIITMNNVNINIIDNLDELITNVYAEPYLFNDSVKNNIMLNKSYSNEEIQKVLNDVEIDINLDYIINENASNLSSGQAQKIALGRALIRDTDIMIFDECTSSIDEETTKIINANIQNLKKDKIIIIVTHDIGEIIESSNIINLDAD